MILENPKVKQHISLFIFLFVNFLFLVKYTYRVTNYYLLVALLVTFSYFLFWKKREIIKKHYKYLNLFNISIILSFIIVSLFIFKKIPVSVLNVDRWSVITSFWDNFFNDKYVYFAKSCDNNPPGPMPFYFILALPFYFIGELGLYSLLGIVSFFIILKKHFTSSVIHSHGLLLVMGSVFYFWEVVCRSNIFFNGTIVLFAVLFFINQKFITYTKSISIGFIIGLVLSTRNVFILPLLLVFIYSLRVMKISFKRFIVVGLIALTTFTITFIPFVINHLQDFMIMNPFMIQSSGLMPFGLTVGFMLLTVFISFFVTTENDVYFYSSLVLFLTIIGYFIFHFIYEGFHDTFFGSKADISYFILCLPFSIFHILHSENNSLTKNFLQNLQ